MLKFVVSLLMTTLPVPEPLLRSIWSEEIEILPNWKALAVLPVPAGGARLAGAVGVILVAAAAGPTVGTNNGGGSARAISSDNRVPAPSSAAVSKLAAARGNQGVRSGTPANLPTAPPGVKKEMHQRLLVASN